jgi:hypothetical protein
MSVADLNPWAIPRAPATPPTRIRQFMPASGWWLVSAQWWPDTGFQGLRWEPVVAWAIVRGPDEEDDEVEAVLEPLKVCESCAEARVLASPHPVDVVDAPAGFDDEARR